MELSEDDLKSMTPEQLAELQRQQCIFCKIVKGDIPSKKVYEDNECIAVLDINPANSGHLLLLPKEHYAIMPQLPEELVSHLAMVSKALSHATLKALKSQGTTVFIANGVAAGQKAPHFMIHIIPRFADDGLRMQIPENRAGKNVSQIAEIVRQRLKGETQPDVKKGKKEDKAKLDRITEMFKNG